MNEKQLKKLTKILGEDTINTLHAMSAEELETAIVLATQEVQNTKEELEANPKYIQVKEDKALLESGLKEVKKINNARIQVAVALLNERGVRVAKGA